MRLEGKVALVTGASAGMGRAIAKRYAEEGAKVYVAARRLERLEELQKECEGLAGSIHPLTVDLMDKKQAEELVPKVVEDAGRIDILVNNAGIMDNFASIGNAADDIIESVFQVDVFSVFYTMRAAVQQFLKQGGGNILNIASVGGLYGARGGSIYTAAKHAVVGITKNTAFMYQNDNIRCNAIAPGAIATEISTQDNMKRIDMGAMGKIQPYMALNQKVGTPEQIAEVALFLGSDESSFVSGDIVKVDGSWTSF